DVCSSDLPCAGRGPGQTGVYRLTLAPGPHALEIAARDADAVFGLVLGLRPPGSAWRSHLAGPGDVVASSLESVRSRLGQGGLRLLPLLPFLPTAAALLALAVLLVTRRRRLQGYVRGVLADPVALPLLSGLCLLL